MLSIVHNEFNIHKCDVYLQLVISSGIYIATGAPLLHCNLCGKIFHCNVLSTTFISKMVFFNSSMVSTQPNKTIPSPPIDVTTDG